MNTELLLLLNIAALVGFTHSLLGPDHSLPIILMAWEKKWSVTKALAMTAIFGTAHVASAFVLGLLGIHMGASLEKIRAIQTATGAWAGWGLIAMGLFTFVWGLKRLYKGATPSYERYHQGYFDVAARKWPILFRISPWALFLIFILGPCELLIPILMMPAAHQGALALTLVTAVFYVATVGTMMTLVGVGVKSVHLLPMKKIERFVPVMAGVGVFMCGIAVKFLGL